MTDMLNMPILRRWLDHLWWLLTNILQFLPDKIFEKENMKNVQFVWKSKKNAFDIFKWNIHKNMHPCAMWSSSISTDVGILYHNVQWLRCSVKDLMANQLCSSNEVRSIHLASANRIFLEYLACEMTNSRYFCRSPFDLTEMHFPISHSMYKNWKVQLVFVPFVICSINRHKYY